MFNGYRALVGEDEEVLEMDDVGRLHSNMNLLNSTKT